MAKDMQAMIEQAEKALEEYNSVDRFDARAFLVKPRAMGTDSEQQTAKAWFRAKLNVLIHLHKLRPQRNVHGA